MYVKVSPGAISVTDALLSRVATAVMSPGCGSGSTGAATAAGAISVARATARIVMDAAILERAFENT